MGQERLSSLALMHIHYQVKIDLDEVVNLFATEAGARHYSEGLVMSIFSSYRVLCRYNFSHVSLLSCINGSDNKKYI